MPLPRLLRRRATAYDRVTFRGKPLDLATADALKLVEGDLGYELTVVQGIGGADASAGTHKDGRAVDLAPYDWQRKVRALKRRGFAAWYRPALPGVWGAHIHAVLILFSIGNSRGVAASAFRQIGSFLRRHNGLANDGADTGEAAYRVSPQPVFQWPPAAAPKPTPPKNNVTRARDRLVEAQAALSQAAALLHDTPDTRDTAQSAGGRAGELATQVERLLDRTPKR